LAVASTRNQTCRENSTWFPMAACVSLANEAQKYSTLPNSDLSYVSPVPAHQRGGRTSSRTRAGSRWTRAALKAGLVRAGRDEPREHGTNRIDGRRSTSRSLRAKPEARVQRNRVVLAVVATVKPWRRRHRVNRRAAVTFAEVREARTNSAPGECGIGRQTIAQGRPGLGCPVSPLCIACASVQHGGFVGASRRPVFPAPFLWRGCDEKHSSGKSCREDASACRLDWRIDAASLLRSGTDTLSAFVGLPHKHAASASAAVVVPPKICTMRAGTVRDTAALILRSCRRAFGGHGFLLFGVSI
jgi:hypothetical protein